MRRSHRIWIGSAGTTTGFGIATSIKRWWGGAAWIVAADSQAALWIPTTRLADESELMPRSDDQSFEHALLEGLIKYEIDTVWPILDVEVVAVAELAAGGVLPPMVAALVPGVETARICFDKLATAEWLTSRGLPVAPTSIAKECNWPGRPIVAKPRYGIGSNGVLEVSHEGGMEAIVGRDDYVVQLRCDKPEVTIDVFRSKDGRCFSVNRERVETKAGVCTKARIFHDRELHDLAASIGAGLDLPGAFNVQVMRAPDDGEWRVIEVNCRPGGGSQMSAAAGFDVVAAAAADVWGEDSSRYITPLQRDSIVLRSYQEWVASS